MREILGGCHGSSGQCGQVLTDDHSSALLYVVAFSQFQHQPDFQDKEHQAA